MVKNSSIFKIILFVLLFIQTNLFGQVYSDLKDSRVIVTLENGSELIGKLKMVSDRKILLKTSFNSRSISISRDKIEGLRKISDLEWFQRRGYDAIKNPIPTTTAISSTAFSLESGTNQVQVFQLFGNKIDFGITDRFMLGVAFESYSIFSGSDQEIFAALTSKYRLTSDESPLHSAVNLNIGAVPESSPDNRIFATLNSINTIGNEWNNLSINPGLAFLENLDNTPHFFLNINAMVHFSPKIGLVTDNIFLFDDYADDYITSFLMRIVINNVTLDLGFTQQESYYFPLVNFNVKF